MNLHDRLEGIAERGTPRGAHEVFIAASADDHAPVAPSRRGRRHRDLLLAAAGLGALIVSVVAIAGVTGSDNRGHVQVRTPSSAEPSTAAPTTTTPTTVPLGGGQVRFTPTDRYTNMRFVSYEGETPNAQGLQTLGWGCITPTNSANGAQLCTDDRWAWIVRTADGPAVFVASHVASTGTADGTLPANVSFVVRNAFTISGLPATSTLQFASRAQDGPEPLGARVLAEAVPPPDPTGVYTTLVQAWELTADGTQLTARGTRGLQVEDPCAATGGKTLSWCTTK